MLSIIIPMYNEEGNVRNLKEALDPVLKEIKMQHEIVFVDDGSSDDTYNILTDIYRDNNSVKIVKFKRNFGQTAAMMAGIDYACGDIIIPMDGDLQNDPRDIPKLLDKMDQGYDVVSGWRKNRKDNALIRNFPSRVANKIISLISGVHLHDYGCSLKAYRREVIKDVKLYGEMHRFIPIYATWHGAKVTEIPVGHHKRVSGKSKYGLERVMKVVLDLIVVKFFSDYSTKPIYIFGAFGILNLFVSVGTAMVILILKLFYSVSFISTPLPILAVTAFSVGILAILLGLVAELVVRTYFESQSKKIYIVEGSK